MRPLLRLQDRGHYRFDGMAASLYRGLRFVAERTRNGYALHRLEDWRRGSSDPHFVVDARGRILHRGFWTGYTAEELVAIPPASP